MRAFVLTALCILFQWRLHAQTADTMQELVALTSGTKESATNFFTTKGLTLIDVDKTKGTNGSMLYGPMKPGDWFDKSGEQILFEFEGAGNYIGSSFDWDPEKKQVDNVSMIRRTVDSLVFEKEMAALKMVNAVRDHSYSIFVSQDNEFVVMRDASSSLNPGTEILTIVRRGSKMGKYLPQLPKKFNTKKR
jgi:hypothetical protein